jgi:hypothetical protein
VVAYLLEDRGGLRLGHFLLFGGHCVSLS